MRERVRNRTAAKALYATAAAAGLAYTLLGLGARWMFATRREHVELWWARRALTGADRP